jgi:hypothetical protein
LCSARKAVQSFRDGAIDWRLSRSPRKWCITGRIRSMLFRAFFAFPFQIRQGNRSTSATITAFAAARVGKTRGQPVRHLFEMLKFHRYVKPCVDGPMGSRASKRILTGGSIAIMCSAC